MALQVSPATITLQKRISIIVLLVFTVAFFNPVCGQSVISGKGRVVHVRSFDLKPGVDTLEFEQHIKRELNPSLEAILPGLEIFIAKGNRGKRPIGNYAYIIIYDSYNSRDKLFPHTGLAPDILAIVQKAHKGIEATANKYIEGGYQWWMKLESYKDYAEIR
ncbi:hypothetical protein [Rufibacter tibetensis]|uniref:Uncharacterized protein n=1 Tax=Rufibacter tibetensis TaxID=512763 RepID=A0A0P0CKX2_9BACT|nr:hypothetical protein [Rufibacter tibetensis]ALJ00220.1 hypothetical protein DC20_16150 [Rufibacter tibetensis]